MTVGWFSAIICAALLASNVAAAEYPSRPIRIIVPFTPGSASDLLARMIGPKLAEAWGQQVVVDNRPSAGGTVARQHRRDVRARRPHADDHVFGFRGRPPRSTTSSLTTRSRISPASRRSPRPLVLVAAPRRPKSVKELIALARRNRAVQLRLVGHRQRHALRRRAFQARCEHQHRARAVSRRARSAHRHDERAHTLRDVAAARRAAARAQRAADRARRDLAAAPARAARRAEHRRSGAAGLRLRRLVRRALPRAHAAPDRRTARAEIARIIMLPENQERIAREGSIARTSTPAEFEKLVHGDR